jgi:hypothetical protein
MKVAIAEELQAAYDLAVQLEMPTAMATASLGKAKLFGLLAQPGGGFRQVGGRKGLLPSEKCAIVAGMTDDELAQGIMGRIKENADRAGADQDEAVAAMRRARSTGCSAGDHESGDRRDEPGFA